MPATRAQLLDRAAIRADMDSSGFPTTDQRIVTLNEQVASLWAWMLNANYPAKRVAISVTATSGGGPYSLALPNLFRVVAVRDARYPGSSLQGWVKRANDLERSFVGGEAWYPMEQMVSNVAYDLEIDPMSGPELSFTPATTAGNFVVECLTEHPGLPDDLSVWYGPAPSDEVLVLRTAAAWREKEDPKGAMHLRAQAEERLGELWQVVQSMATPTQPMDFISWEEPCFGRSGR